MTAGTLVLAGCHHKAKPTPMPVPPPVTVALAPTPEPTAPRQVQSEPVTPTPLPSKPVQPKARKPKKKVIEAPPPPPPVVVASTGPPPAESVIGALTVGGEDAPADKQRASETIAAVEKRLAGLSTMTVDSKKEGLMRVRNFLRQAHEALTSGDALGASTLATKAKVLLDDLLQ
jgi:outer membrane biosynthesis protein TonB